MRNAEKLIASYDLGPVVLDLLLKAGGEHSISNADFGDVAASWKTNAVEIEMEKTADGVTVRVVSRADSF